MFFRLLLNRNGCFAGWNMFRSFFSRILLFFWNRRTSKRVAYIKAFQCHLFLSFAISRKPNEICFSLFVRLFNSTATSQCDAKKEKMSLLDLHSRVEFGVTSPWFQCNVLRFMGQFIGMLVGHIQRKCVHWVHCAVAELPLHWRGLKMVSREICSPIFCGMLLVHSIEESLYAKHSINLHEAHTHKSGFLQFFYSAIEQIFRAHCESRARAISAKV